MSDQSRSVRIIYVEKSLSKRCKKRTKWILIILFIFVFFSVLFLFIGFPLIFMNSIQIQRLFMFNNFYQEPIIYERHCLRAGLNNFHVDIIDQKTYENISLGVWHLVPLNLVNASATNESFSFENVLTNPEINVVLYFYGNGQTRSDNLLKFKAFQKCFQVITFDYRSYGDSTKATLSEDAIIRDSIQLYKWLLSKTTAPIYFWGHSLGSALAARTAAELQINNLRQPRGLVLESAFTSMREEIARHPYGKIFAWLPYFKQTILDPLKQNGFVFDTAKHIADIRYPIMILGAEDDVVVPPHFGHELCKIARNRTAPVVTLCYTFPYIFQYNHIFIYEDEILPLFIRYLIYKAEQRHKNVTYSKIIKNKT